MALPWIIRLKTFLTALRTLCRSLILTTKDWLLCLGSYREQCNQSKQSGTCGSHKPPVPVKGFQAIRAIAAQKHNEGQVARANQMSP